MYFVCKGVIGALNCTEKKNLWFMIVDILLFFVGWSNHMECFDLAHAEVQYRFPLTIEKTSI